MCHVSCFMRSRTRKPNFLWIFIWFSHGNYSFSQNSIRLPQSCMSPFSSCLLHVLKSILICSCFLQLSVFFLSSFHPLSLTGGCAADAVTRVHVDQEAGTRVVIVQLQGCVVLILKHFSEWMNSYHSPSSTNLLFFRRPVGTAFHQKFSLSVRHDCQQLSDLEDTRVGGEWQTNRGTNGKMACIEKLKFLRKWGWEGGNEITLQLRWQLAQRTLLPSMAKLHFKAGACHFFSKSNVTRERRNFL